MSEETTVKDEVRLPPGKRHSLNEVTTPIFSKEAGQRMALMRMKLLMDQKQLGELLGVSQMTVSKLERGAIPVARGHLFTTSRFLEVFGNLSSHILFGTGEDRFSRNEIVRNYRETKFKTERKNANPAIPSRYKRRARTS